MVLIITLSVLREVLKENIGPDSEKNMVKFEAFDLKITKLTGNNWDREDRKKLLVQLMNGQANPRHSIESRVTIAFDKSPNSSPEFVRLNKPIIVDALVEISRSPYEYSFWLASYRCWGSIYIFQFGEYQYLPDYYEHPIGGGLREPEKAEISKEIIEEAAIKSGFRIRPNRNFKEIGKDGELKIDLSKLVHINETGESQLELF